MDHALTKNKSRNYLAQESKKMTFDRKDMQEFKFQVLVESLKRFRSYFKICHIFDPLHPG